MLNLLYLREYGTIIETTIGRDLLWISKLTVKFWRSWLLPINSVPICDMNASWTLHFRSVDRAGVFKLIGMPLWNRRVDVPLTLLVGWTNATSNEHCLTSNGQRRRSWLQTDSYKHQCLHVTSRLYFKMQAIDPQGWLNTPPGLQNKYFNKNDKNHNLKVLRAQKR